jgi:hypothetical protein
MNLVEMEPQLATTMSGEATDPMEHPGVESPLVIDLMGDGSFAERNPRPAATILASGAAAEVLVQRLSESAQAFGKDGGPDEEPFASKPVTGDPAEIFGGIKVIGGDEEGAQAFIRKLIGAVERPVDDTEASTAAEQIEDGRIEEEPQVDERAGWGKTAMLAFRRSRAGMAVSAATITAGGVLGFGASSAKALSPLEQECVTDGMARMNIAAAKFYGAHKDGGNNWHGQVRGHLNAMPQECTDNDIYRVLNYRVQLQNAKHPANWFMIYPWMGSKWNGRVTNNGAVNNDEINGGVVGFDNISWLHNPNWVKWAYQCRPGPAKTQVRLQEVHTVIHTDGVISEYGSHINGKIDVLGKERIYDRPLKVYGAC